MARHLTHDRVSNPADALSYLTDCTLATVEDLAGRSRPPKGELKRQIEIAQKSIDWMIQFGIEPSGRGARVIAHGGNVANWVASRQ